MTSGNSIGLLMVLIILTLLFWPKGPTGRH